jgi:hypothetical protein
VQMQIELARLIREVRPRGVVIELADPDHLPVLCRALGEWPLSDYVALRQYVLSEIPSYLRRSG